VRDAARAGDRAALQDEINQQPLEQERESTPHVDPRHAHLTHAVRRALHPRHQRKQECLVLTRVEVAPHPLLGVVVTGAARRQ
jgi:hypothetical protein